MGSDYTFLPASVLNYISSFNPLNYSIKNMTSLSVIYKLENSLRGLENFPNCHRQL
jgi:hypothetical protein